MKEQLARSGVIVISMTLLALSVGVIYWISQDERSRLALREKAALEAAAHLRERETMLGSDGPVSGNEEAEKMLHDIDRLLINLSSDDLPDEE